MKVRLKFTVIIIIIIITIIIIIIIIVINIVVVVVVVRQFSYKRSHKKERFLHMTLYPAGLFSSFYICLDGTTRFSHRYVHRGCHQRPAGLLLTSAFPFLSQHTFTFLEFKISIKKERIIQPNKLVKD